jgi:hypothetical protein
VGNTPGDVIGCFAAGSTESSNFVGGSGSAMKVINSVIAADGSGKITVTVNGATQ